MAGIISWRTTSSVPDRPFTFIGPQITCFAGRGNCCGSVQHGSCQLCGIPWRFSPTVSSFNRWAGWWPKVYPAKKF